LKTFVILQVSIQRSKQNKCNDKAIKDTRIEET